MGNEDSRAQGVRRAFWPKLAGNLARLPFAEDVVAAYYCAVDLATPLRAKGILDRKSTRLNSSHVKRSRMPSSA